MTSPARAVGQAGCAAPGPVTAGKGGFGFVCWRRNGDGRKSGEPMTAATLDDLAGLVEHREAHPDKPADA